MKMASVPAFMLGVLVLLLLALGYVEYVYSAGWPDGHVTEYAAAVRGLYYYCAIPGLALMSYSLWLGRQARTQPIKVKLLQTAMVAVAVLAIFVGVDGHYYHALDHGQGG
ncbi:hypothetical protein ACKC9G_00445 [Pokkaliibacter sp. CJK22405]|uniref:hypothetical protein n=1 Tax=Pokkaliibacter sp. CJK22405 TaxID=3384615 RepID=UPI003984F24E